MDPTVKLGLAMRAAPLMSAEFAFKQGTDEKGQPKWVPGIQAKNPEVGKFVLRQLKRIWQHDLSKILSAQKWGWSAGEVVLKLTPEGMVEFDTILPRHARDVRPLIGNGEVKAVRFLRVRGATGNIELRFPKSFWHVFRDDEGTAHNMSILHGAYSPFADKWFEGGGLDVRRLFMHKDAYGGVDMTYPPGTTNIDGKEEVPNRDIAREIAEQIKAGGVTTRPGVFDPIANKPLWELTRATVPANPAHILEYPKDLDVEILRGIEIPDDVLTSEGTGAWQGKQVPFQAFYSGLNIWLTAVIRVVVKQIIEPLVLLNFGSAEEFEVMTKPLDIQAMEMQRANQPEGVGGGFQGPEQNGQPTPGGGGGQFVPHVGPRGGAGFKDVVTGQVVPNIPGQGGRGAGGARRPQPGTSVGGKRFGLDAGPMDPIQAVGEGVLLAGELVTAAKEAMRIRLARPFDESKISREGKGKSEGGQFTSQQGAGVEKTDADKIAEPQVNLGDVFALKETSEQLASDINEDEAGAIADYVGDGFVTLNRQLRSCPDTLDCLGMTEKDMFKGVNSAIEKAGDLPFAVTAWRGVDLSPEDSNALVSSITTAAESGGIIRFDGITSSSLDPDVAVGFAPGANVIIFKINSTSGAYLGDVLGSEEAEEKELLQKHGQQYRPVSIDRAGEILGRKAVVIELEQVA